MLQSGEMNRAIFLDRDGVLNELVERKDGSMTAPWSITEFQFTPYAKTAIEILSYMDYKTLVVTNQPDLNRGTGPLTITDLDLMHKMIKKWLKVDDICYSEDRGSDTYKPNNGMIEKLIKEYMIDRSQSFMIGDRWKDIVAGYRSKLTTIFVGHEYTYPYEHRNIQPDYIVKSVLEAATLIEEMNK